jgi:hypothetical protein
MNIEILFYTRHDFGGWRQYSWLPVQLVQGDFVHCEILTNRRVLNASNRHGVQWQPINKYVPSSIISIDVDKSKFDTASNEIVGNKYSWISFLKLLIPKWGSDPDGMICSELVAFMLLRSATNSEFKILFNCVPPHRWTPDQLHYALNKLTHKLLVTEC